MSYVGSNSQPISRLKNGWQQAHSRQPCSGCNTYQRSTTHAAGIDWEQVRKQPAPEFLVPVAQTATEEAVDWELTSLAARDPHRAHVSYAAVQPASDISAGGLYATGRPDGGNRNEEEHNHAGALDLSLQMQVGSA